MILVILKYYYYRRPIGDSWKTCERPIACRGVNTILPHGILKRSGLENHKVVLVNIMEVTEAREHIFFCRSNFNSYILTPELRNICYMGLQWVFANNNIFEQLVRYNQMTTCQRSFNKL